MFQNRQSDGIESIVERLVLFHGAVCPNCKEYKLVYSGQHGTLGQSFSKWEANSGKLLSPEVLMQYCLDQAYYLFECAQCGFGSFFPRIAGSAEFYDAVADSRYYEDVKDEFIYVIDFVCRKNINSLIDVGAGSGVFLRYLKGQAPAVARFACEKNPSTIEDLAQVATVYSDFENLTRQFDALCAFQLLEHLEEPFDFIETCRKVLVQGGYLFLSVPDYSGPYRYYGDSWTEIPPHHLTRWTPRSLSSLLVRRGFSKARIIRLPLRSTYFPAYVPLLWWQFLRSIRLEKNVWLVNKGKGIASLLQRFRIKHLPFVPMVLLAIAKKD